jgi:hypothetical protein
MSEFPCNIEYAEHGQGPALLFVPGSFGTGAVVATASRPETMSWVKDLGAHYVINHGKPIAAQVATIFGELVGEEGLADITLRAPAFKTNGSSTVSITWAPQPPPARSRLT